jgi:hypothetical protein
MTPADASIRCELAALSDGLPPLHDQIREDPSLLFYMLEMKDHDLIDPLLWHVNVKESFPGGTEMTTLELAAHLNASVDMTTECEQIIWDHPGMICHFGVDTFHGLPLEFEYLGLRTIHDLSELKFGDIAMKQVPMENIFKGEETVERWIVFQKVDDDKFYYIVVDRSNRS